jgi:hypothetical protein
MATIDLADGLGNLPDRTGSLLIGTLLVDYVLSIDIHVIAATILSPFLLVVENYIRQNLEVETVPIMQD